MLMEDEDSRCPFCIDRSSYLPDGSELYHITTTAPRPPPSYADRFGLNAGTGGGLPAACRSGSMGSATSLQTPRTPAIGGFETDEPWLAAELPADYIPAVPLPLLTSVTSTFCSPLQSARGAKRRVMSSSTLSSDIPSDIISLIRYSPTEIPVFGGNAAAGRPTSSLTQFGRLASGSISHLSARNINPASSAAVRTQHHQQLTDVNIF